MFQLLGLFDILAAGLLLGGVLEFNLAPATLNFFAAYLILKGLFFFLSALDWGSLIDVAAGVILLPPVFTFLPFPILGIFGLVLGIKGLMSVFT